MRNYKRTADNMIWKVIHTLCVTENRFRGKQLVRHNDVIFEQYTNVCKMSNVSSHYSESRVPMGDPGIV